MQEKEAEVRLSVSSDNSFILCVLASLTPLSSSHCRREDLVFEVLQAHESSSLSWVSNSLYFFLLFVLSAQGTKNIQESLFPLLLSAVCEKQNKTKHLAAS